MKKTKIKALLSAAAAILFWGCAAPMPETIKIEGKNDYTMTVLGDTHFDGQEYHITEPTYENQKRERKRNLAQWEGKSQMVLAAAAARSSKDVPFIIQLGDLTQGDCENYDLHAAMFKGAFDVFHKFFPGKKIFSLRGNHDGRWKGVSTSAVDEHFVPLIKKELGREDIEMDGTNYAIRYGKDLYIFYDYTKESSGNFVRTTLQKNSDARHIFFLTHLPLFPCSSGNPGWIVNHFKELIPLLAKHNAIVLCAHTHTWGEFIYRCKEGTIPQLIVTSMGSAWNPEMKSLTKWRSSFDEWHKNINPRYFKDPNNDWSIKNAACFKNSDFLRYQIYRGAPSGFVNLEVTDTKVVAHIFTDNSGKPIKSVVLREKK